jgi:hypothetical protein
MKAEAALRNVSLHDPVENEPEGFPKEVVGNDFFDSRAIHPGSRVIEAGIRR